MPETATPPGSEPDKAAGALLVPWRNLIWWAAAVAGVVAFLATMAIPGAGFSAASQIGVGVPRVYYAAAAWAVPPILALVGVAIAHWRRVLSHVLVLVGGLGTCALAGLAVALSGPDQTTFLPLQEGAQPHMVVVSAIVATVAALVTIAASAIDMHGD